MFIKRIKEKAKKLLLKAQNIKILDNRKLYKCWEQQLLSKMINEFAIDCIFDVGANHGQYATMLRKKCGYKGLIVSFEPIPLAAQHLAKLSARDPNWIVLEMALSDTKGECTFNIMTDNQFSSLSTPVHNETPLFTRMNQVEQSVMVKCDNLDNVFSELADTYHFKRPFLKLDTQGYDLNIVKHASACISSFVGLQSELSIKRLYADSVEYTDAIKFYESLGFSLTAFIPNNSGHFPLLVETDCLMVNNAFLAAA